MEKEKYMIKLYKCRLCGEVFEEGTAPENQHHIFMSDLAIGKHTTHLIADRSAHYTDDHIGLADFIGFKYVFKEETNDV